METVWTWKFFDALVADENGVLDALKEVNYLLTGTRGDKSYKIGGRTSLGPADPVSFVSFSSLTEEDIVSFVSTSVDVDALKAQINAWHDAKLKKFPFEDSPDNVPFEGPNAEPAPNTEAEELRFRIAELEALVLKLTPPPAPDITEPPPEVMAEAQPDESFADLKARLLAEFASLRNMLVGHIPMSEPQLLRLQALEHPKFQTWLQG